VSRIAEAVVLVLFAAPLAYAWWLIIRAEVGRDGVLRRPSSQTVNPGGGQRNTDGGRRG
jgi:hypothetical protein